MTRLDIISDPICPWCHIGHARLLQALAARPDHPFEIVWHPFQLNPEMPPGGMARAGYYAAKFGNPERAAQIEAQIHAAAREAGLDFDLGAIPLVPNTLDAHRLIHWAGIEGRQSEVVAALFRAYFDERRDIGDAATLASIAGEAGLDAAMITLLLAGEADRALIAERDAAARRMGVTAVPTFIVGGRHAVPGAQPPEFWLQLIGEIEAALGAPD